MLEGSREDVLETYHKIAIDDRHKNVIKLVNEPLSKRVFPQWSMGFAALSPEKLKELEGYINPDNELFNTGISHPAIAILKAFAEANRLPQDL